MTQILSGFAAVVFVAFTGWSIYSYLTTPEESVPGSLRSSRAKFIYYWGLVTLAAAILAGSIGICYWVGSLIQGAFQ